MSIKCGIDGSCPFLYSCRNSACHHDPIFPLTPLQYAIFSLFPICSAICNLSGNSFGEWKVLIFMDILNYQQNQATTLAYPLITGTALYNFFDLILKRHPTRNTSLIDYNIVLIIIPNILFGSTIGSLVNKFIPPIVADSIITPIMIAFSIKFFLRFWNFRKQAKQQENQKVIQIQLTDKSNSFRVTNLLENQSRDTQKLHSVNLSHVEDEDIINQKQNNQLQNRHTEQVQSIKINLSNSSQTKQQQQLQQVIQKPRESNFDQATPAKPVSTLSELQIQQQYESTLHLPHVLATIVIFLVFETLSFLVQGKIIPFSVCSTYYPIGLSVLTLLFLGFDFFMYKYTDRKIQYYRKIGYRYDLKINVPKYYLMICVGAFLGGFNGGTFGIGNSTTVIFTLLFLDAQPAVVSATVGYQVVFAGSASLIQATAQGNLQHNVALLFFLITFVLGGICTFFAKKFVSQFSQIKVSQCLMLIVFCLVTTSVFALIAAIILGYKQFGAANMQDVPFHC